MPTTGTTTGTTTAGPATPVVSTVPAAQAVQAVQAVRGVRVSLAQLARRTGLADSAATMAVVCERSEVAVTAVGDRSYAAASAFAGGECPVELGDVVVLDTGRLA